MRRKTVLVVLLILLIILCSTSKFIIETQAEPKTWIVDDDGPADFHTIQEAINAAFPGDTIYVAAGTYYERIKVNKTLTLIGEDPTTTIIDGSGAGLIVNVTADYVKIMNFTIQNGKYYVGVWVENPSGSPIVSVSISKNIFVNNYACVILSRSIGATITDNVMKLNQYGIRVYSSKLTSITHNTIENSLFYGIHLHTRSENNTIKLNELLYNKYGIHIETSDYNEISRNEIISATDKNGYGIRLTTSKNTIIVGNTIQFNYRGIVLWENSVNNTIYYNNFLNNTEQHYHYNTPLSANLWDTNICPGAEGNYWSDYQGVDDGSGEGRWGEPRVAGDGVGDTLIPHQNVDYYPLMHPWALFPIARFTYSPEQPCVNETVNFDASASSGDLISYEWDFGDGSPKVVESGPVTTHIYEAIGNYTVTLTVTDREGLTNSTSKTITVLPFRLQLDVYTQKEPYSGKGYNQTSDSFAPQEMVTLYGLVTFNDDPVPSKSVVFDVYDPNGTRIVSRSDFTDSQGIATVNFTLATNATFGTYLVIGNVEVSGNIATDYLRFEVGWIINIVRIEIVDVMGVTKTEFKKGETVYINVALKNIAFTPKNVTLTFVICDEKSTPIALASFQGKIDPGLFEFNTIAALNIPQWSLVGVASIYTNAFTNWMWEDGIPYCPENVTCIYITP